MSPKQAYRNWKFKRKYGCRPEEAWNVDSWLAPALATRLEAFADNLHSYPADRTPEGWETEILMAAADLRQYVSDDYLEIDDLDRSAEMWIENIKSGERAMHWVADNLNHLWD